MNYKIEEIEGIGPKYGETLGKAGIETTGDLLEHCCSAPGRKKTAEATGLSEKLLLTWTNLADLMRISGIGPQFSELLEAAGVDTVKELRNRNADNLAEKMKEVNEAKRLARSTPAPAVVQGWVQAAKEIEPKMTY